MASIEAIKGAGYIFVHFSERLKEILYPAPFSLYQRSSLDMNGILYAVASGALTSGVGYAIWYTVLPALKNTSAASVQLSVPVIAALGGVIFLAEPMTLRLLLTSTAILGGIALVIVKK